MIFKFSNLPKSLLKEVNEADLPKKMHRWLMDNKITIVDVNRSKKHLRIGLDDPTNELLIEKIINNSLMFLFQSIYYFNK